MPLQIDLHPCLEVDAPSVRRIVGIELAVEPVDVDTAGTTRVRASCTRDATLLEVDDGVTGKLTSRQIDLEGTARVARSRLLALSIAELVSASWAELRLRPIEDAAPVFTPVAPQPVRDVARRVIDARLAAAPPPPPGPIRRVSRARLMIGGTFGGSGRPAHVIGGGHVEALVDLGPRVSLSLGMDLMRGRVRASIGDVRDDRIGWSAALVLRRPIGTWWIAGGIGARVGRARLEGDRDAPSARIVSAPFGGAFLVGETWRVVWGRLLVGARLELGTVTLPVVGRAGDASGPVVAAVDGAWSTLSLGVGVAL